MFLLYFFFTEKPAEFTLPLKDKHCIETESAEFTVRLTKPNIQVTWFRDGKEITPDDNFQPITTEKDHKLVINDSQLEFTGTYKCVLASGLESSAKLTVEGVWAG